MTKSSQGRRRVVSTQPKMQGTKVTVRYTTKDADRVRSKGKARSRQNFRANAHSLRMRMSQVCSNVSSNRVQGGDKRKRVRFESKPLQDHTWFYLLLKDGRPERRGWTPADVLQIHRLALEPKGCLTRVPIALFRSGFFQS